MSKRENDIRRAKLIIIYMDRIHTCLDDIYEYLVDREYLKFKDEVASAIEHLETLLEKKDDLFRDRTGPNQGA
jgi:hypothetical protein